jgi:hydrogenase nickel incorporation protein HypB
VLVGDIATDRDAQRLAEHAPAVQLTTGGACHLEYPLIEQGWQALGEPEVDFLFVENIGNLVCPASHDLGEHLRVLLLSTTEGDDKPAKYPKAFRTSHALVITKIDLLPYVPFSVEQAVADARSVRGDLPVFTTSVHPPLGLEPWCDYLKNERRRMLAGEVCRPNR